MDRSGRNLSFWPKAVAGEVSEGDWKEFVKVGILVLLISVGFEKYQSMDSSDLIVESKTYPLKTNAGGASECWR